jgi:hypothetical protein
VRARVEKQAVEGKDPRWGPAVRVYICFLYRRIQLHLTVTLKDNYVFIYVLMAKLNELNLIKCMQENVFQALAKV